MSTLPRELDGATTWRIRTRGRTTGADHVVTTWFAPAGEHVYVAVRHGRRSDWLRNALAQREVTVARGRRSWPAHVALVESPDEEGHALDSFAEKYVRDGAVVRAWRADPPTFVRFTLVV